MTSKETEIKLTNVARASLEELLEGLPRLSPRPRPADLGQGTSRRATPHAAGGKPNAITKTTERYSRPPGGVIADNALCLIHQTNYLVDQQLRQLEPAFVKEGGLRER